jgi:8-oxo-dGTP diphosphatase
LPSDQSPDSFAALSFGEPSARFCLAVLLNDRNEILLMRRALDDDFAPGLWGLPGGHIHPNESPDDTIRRELEEEVGMGVRVRAIRRVGPVRDTLYGGVFEIHLYLYHFEGGVIQRNSEHSEHAWVSENAYGSYDVVPGIDEDLRYLDVWPSSAM